MASRTLRALITAGGTSEPVDDVRVLTNVSRGDFGFALAQAFASLGVETTLLGSEYLCTRLGASGDDYPFEIESFFTFDDLATALPACIERIRPDIILMAAAVSDYKPVRKAGKISSDEEEMVIRLFRNPKLLPQLRELAGEQAYIVGFKLLSDVCYDELKAVAERQITGNRLDLCVANDIRRIDKVLEIHPVLLVDADGRHHSLDGPRSVVAHHVAHHITAGATERIAHD